MMGWQYFALTIIITWIITVILKTITTGKPYNIKNGIQNGGMPSQHTATLASITTAIYLTEGPTQIFFLAIVLLSIIMVDATTIRYQQALHAQIINELLKKDKLKIIKGHTKKQVLIGLIIGILTATLTLTFFP